MSKQRIGSLFLHVYVRQPHRASHTFNVVVYQLQIQVTQSTTYTAMSIRVDNKHAYFTDLQRIYNIFRQVLHDVLST